MRHIAGHDDALAAVDGEGLIADGDLCDALLLTMPSPSSEANRVMPTPGLWVSAMLTTQAGHTSIGSAASAEDSGRFFGASTGRAAV